MTKEHQIQTNQKYKSYPVTMLAFDGALLLDIAGPLQVFAAANKILGANCYAISIASDDGMSISTDTGVRIEADLRFDQIPSGGDLLIPGGPGVDSNLDDVKFIQFIKDEANSQKRLVSICSGSLLAAEAGLLDGKKATSHWARSSMLKSRFPNVNWEIDEVFTVDGNVFCSAGVTAGIDLALALVEIDHSKKVALAVAKELVVFIRRSGGQKQYSESLKAQSYGIGKIANLCAAIAEKPQLKWTLFEMAAYSNMTERTLHRHFIAELGQSPTRFLENLRLEVAKSIIDQTGDDMRLVSEACGFASEQTLYRVFKKQLGITPKEYMSRFG